MPRTRLTDRQIMQTLEILEPAEPDGYAPPQDHVTALDFAVARVKSTSPGAPVKYIPEMDEIVEQLHMSGSSVPTICAILGISGGSYYNYCKDYPSFLAAVMKGRELADAKVAKSIFRNATGYSHPAVHISVHEGNVTRTPYVKHYPPNAAAGEFWMTNRQRARWRKSQTVDMHMSDGQGVDASRPPSITINAVKKATE